MITTKILVVDNDPAYRESLVEDVLKPEGFVVFQASSPEEARHFLEDELIHLALVDIRLVNDDDPNDRSGLHLCEQMEPTVARIIVTGFPDWQLVRDALKPTRGRHRVADGFIYKPEGPEFVLAGIRQVLREEFEIIPTRRIAVLASGGDSPGTNAAIWAVVHIALGNDIEILGVQDGYRGLASEQIYKLTWSSVSDIMAQGGTILGTARFPEFKNRAVRQRAVDNIIRRQISGLIVIGGDGAMHGAQKLAEDLAAQGRNVPMVAIPTTIDNDLWGTDISLGATSVANAMIEELRNMIRPAQALQRIFVCETMGRYCGYLALQSALGIGADAVIIPEQVVEVTSPHDPDDSMMWKNQVTVVGTEDSLRKKLEQIAVLLEAAFAAGKQYGFIVLAEGIGQLTSGRLNGEYVRVYLEDRIRHWSSCARPDVRAHVLGYPVRGVAPDRFDVWLGARLGSAAVQCLLAGKTNVMVGWSEERGIIETSFDEVIAKSNCPPKEIWQDRPKWQELLELQEALACPPGLREQLKARGNRFVL